MSDKTYWHVPGMMNPYWITYVQQDWPNPGDATTVAVNSAADTDMGNLYGTEFSDMFPNAVQITREAYMERVQ